MNYLADNIFDDKMLPDILDRYNAFSNEKNKELSSTVNSLKLKLSDVESKINNIVNVVMETGSAALANKLRELEENKEQLNRGMEIAENELSKNRVDEKQLKELFDKAKQMLRSGLLKHKKAIINEFLNRIIITRDKIRIEFNISDYRFSEDILR